MSASRLLALPSQVALSRRTVRCLLVLLLVWSGGLRAWYATPRLDSSRFYDERFPMHNASRILAGHGLRPATGLHPGLAHLPHTAVLLAARGLSAVFGNEIELLTPEGEFTPISYLICRLLQALLGTASLLLLYLVGRRLGGPALGLLAAFLAAVVPWHLRQSVVFKADIVLVFTLVLAFLLAQRALEQPAALRYAVAGAAVGLALSAKYNGGPIAIALAVGTWLTVRPARRGWALLVLAGSAAVVAFLALNPYVLAEFEIYRRGFSSTARAYAIHGAEAGVDSPVELSGRALESLLSPGFHGRWVGAAGLAGLALTSILALARARRSATAAGWAMVGGYVISYLGLYAIVTTNPTAHSWLPVSPFVALAAAWSFLSVWVLASRRLPEAQRRVVGAILAGLLVVPLAASASRFVYTQTLPPTGHLALHSLRDVLGRAPGRLVASEHDFQLGFNERSFTGRLAIEILPLVDLDPTVLDRLDAEVFPAERLHGANAEVSAFYRKRVERLPPEAVVHIAPRPFHAHGPELVVLLHPHRRESWTGGGSLSPDPRRPRLYRGRLPQPPHPRGRLLSLRLFVPPDFPFEGAELRTSDGPVRLVPFRTRGGWELVTHRFRARRGLRLRLTTANRSEPLGYSVHAWRPPRLEASDAP